MPRTAEKEEETRKHSEKRMREAIGVNNETLWRGDGVCEEELKGSFVAHIAVEKVLRGLGGHGRPSQGITCARHCSLVRDTRLALPFLESNARNVKENAP